MRDLKLVNGHVYRRANPTSNAHEPRRGAHASARVFSVHIVAAAKSRGARIAGADPGRFYGGTVANYHL